MSKYKQLYRNLIGGSKKQAKDNPSGADDFSDFNFDDFPDIEQIDPTLQLPQSMDLTQVYPPTQPQGLGHSPVFGSIPTLTPDTMTSGVGIIHQSHGSGLGPTQTFGLVPTSTPVAMTPNHDVQQGFGPQSVLLPNLDTTQELGLPPPPFLQSRGDMYSQAQGQGQGGSQSGSQGGSSDQILSSGLAPPPLLQSRGNVYSQAQGGVQALPHDTSLSSLSPELAQQAQGNVFVPPPVPSSLSPITPNPLPLPQRVVYNFNTFYEFSLHFQNTIKHLLQDNNPTFTLSIENPIHSCILKCLLKDADITIGNPRGIDQLTLQPVRTERVTTINLKNLIEVIQRCITNRSDLGLPQSKLIVLF